MTNGHPHGPVLPPVAELARAVSYLTWVLWVLWFMVVAVTGADVVHELFMACIIASAMDAVLMVVMLLKRDLRPYFRDALVRWNLMAVLIPDALVAALRVSHLRRLAIGIILIAGILMSTQQRSWLGLIGHERRIKRLVTRQRLRTPLTWPVVLHCATRWAGDLAYAAAIAWTLAVAITRQVNMPMLMITLALMGVYVLCLGYILLAYRRLLPALWQPWWLHVVLGMAALVMAFLHPSLICPGILIALVMAYIVHLQIHSTEDGNDK